MDQAETLTTPLHPSPKLKGQKYSEKVRGVTCHCLVVGMALLGEKRTQQGKGEGALLLKPQGIAAVEGLWGRSEAAPAWGHRVLQAVS